MEPSLMLRLYKVIMDAENSTEIAEATERIHVAVLGQKLTDEREIMILKLAIEIKSLHFLIHDTLLSGEVSYFAMEESEDVDFEQMQLDEFQEQELDEFKDGNVILMKDFDKKE